MTETFSNISFGIAGYGYIGKVYADILKSRFNASQIYIADPLLPKSNTSFNSFRDYKDLTNCNAIIMALPTNMHKDALEFFSDNRKYILIEKPLGTDYNESKQIVDIITK